MIKQSVVAAVFGFCDSLNRANPPLCPSVLATLRSPWSNLS